jgi:hypothetical protein
MHPEYPGPGRGRPGAPEVPLPTAGSLMTTGILHFTKLDATAKSQLLVQSYQAALAERTRKAAFLSDGKKM